MCYEDDASRFVIRYGVFEHATTENALAVLEEAIKNHGKPASIMTYRRSQFYANASEVKEKEKEKEKGASVFEKKLVELGIKQILSGLTFTDQRQSRETTVRCSASCQSLRQS